MAESNTLEIDEQYNDILSYTINLCYRFDKELNDNINAIPRCEKDTGPAKIAYWEDLTLIPPSKLHRDYRGNEVHNARGCPHCKAVVYSSAAIGQIVACLNCGGAFTWSV